MTPVNNPSNTNTIAPNYLSAIESETALPKTNHKIVSAAQDQTKADNVTNKSDQVMSTTVDLTPPKNEATTETASEIAAYFQSNISDTTPQEMANDIAAYFRSNNIELTPENLDKYSQACLDAITPDYLRGVPPYDPVKAAFTALYLSTVDLMKNAIQRTIASAKLMKESSDAQANALEEQGNIGLTGALASGISGVVVSASGTTKSLSGINKEHIGSNVLNQQKMFDKYATTKLNLAGTFATEKQSLIQANGNFNVPVDVLNAGAPGPTATPMQLLEGDQYGRSAAALNNLPALPQGTRITTALRTAAEAFQMDGKRIQSVGDLLNRTIGNSVNSTTGGAFNADKSNSEAAGTEAAGDGAVATAIFENDKQSKEQSQANITAILNAWATRAKDFNDARGTIKLV